MSPPCEKRPVRPGCVNELGQPRTLADGPECFQRLGPASETLLVLGLGPDPAGLAGRLAREKRPPRRVGYLECPAFAAQAPASWREGIPKSWREVAPEEALAGLDAQSSVLIYSAGLRLFPSFWGPILARLQLALCGVAAARPAGVRDLVLLPGGERGLLIRELVDAFKDLGFEARTLDPGTVPERLPELLRHDRPRLFFSVNFAALDPFGQTFHLLQAAGVPTAVWCVDNPFHLISGLKAPFWRQVLLCVTDDWFLAPLAREGAARTLHLPLAASPRFFSPGPSGQPDLAGRTVFVGRGEFPGKRGFFAGCRAPRDLMDTAVGLLLAGGRPDFAWWLDKLGITRLWPGNAARAAGFGAEECGRAFRAACLAEAAATGRLTAFGDVSLASIAPAGTDLRPEVDYYGPLSGVYAEAAYCLNATSPLLPHGLTQRHFDVFAAGGCLISDATPGLSLFPAELTRPIVFGAPRDIPGTINRLEAERGLRADLIAAWRTLLLERHGYVRRLETVLAAVKEK